MVLPGFYAEAALIAPQHRYMSDRFLDEHITIVPQQDPYCKGGCVRFGHKCTKGCHGDTDCIVRCSQDEWECIKGCGFTTTGPFDFP